MTRARPTSARPEHLPRVRPFRLPKPAPVAGFRRLR